MNSYNTQDFRYMALDKQLNEIKDISSYVEEGGTIDYNSLTRLKATCTVPISLRYDEVLNLVGLRVYHMLNGIDECLGTFLISTPKNDFEDDVQTVEATGYSTLWRISNNSPSDRYYVPKGTNCIAEIKRILTMLGFSFSMQDSTKTTSNNKEFDVGENYLNIINYLLDVVNYTSLHVDVWGVYQAHPYVLPQDRPIEKTYDENEEDNIVEPMQSTEFDLFNVYNKFIYYCSSDPLLSLHAIYEQKEGITGTNNTWVNTYVEEVQDVADYDTLYEKCKRKAEESTSIYYKATINTAIEMRSPYMATVALKQYQSNAKYSVTSFNIALELGGSMTLNMRRSVVV